MPVIPAHDAAEFVVGPTTFTALARPATGTIETSVWRVEVAPGGEGAPHHVTREEVFLALAGTARVTLDGASHDLAAGDALVVPAGTTIALRNPGPAPFEAVAVLPVGAEVVTADGTRFVPPWAS